MNGKNGVESEMIEFFFRQTMASSDGFRIRAMYWKSKSWDLEEMCTWHMFFLLGGRPANQTHAYEAVASISLIYKLYK